MFASVKLPKFLAIVDFDVSSSTLRDVRDSVREASRLVSLSAGDFTIEPNPCSPRCLIVEIKTTNVGAGDERRGGIARLGPINIRTWRIAGGL